jgi:hypothetical protein
MPPDRKKPGVAFWATVVVVVALAYPLSSGPAVWLDIKFLGRSSPTWLRATVGKLYVPLAAGLEYGPNCLQQLWADYIGWW